VYTHTGGSGLNVTEQGSDHGRIISHAAVLVHTHTDESCSNVTEVRTLSYTDDKAIRWCSVHPSRSQIATVRAMTITANSLLPRPKCDCDGGYDVAMKGLSVVVFGSVFLVSVVLSTHDKYLCVYC